MAIGELGPWTFNSNFPRATGFTAFTGIRASLEIQAEWKLIALIALGTLKLWVTQEEAQNPVSTNKNEVFQIVPTSSVGLFSSTLFLLFLLLLFLCFFFFLRIEQRFLPFYYFFLSETCFHMKLLLMSLLSWG